MDLRAHSSMDRASASEAGNVGSTPAERKFLPKTHAFVVAHLLEYLRAPARALHSILHKLTPRKRTFYFENFVHAKTARPGPEALYVSKMTERDSR